MEINGEEIGFSILPYFDKVQASIFRLYKLKKEETMQINLISKEFGSMWRQPIKQDYIDARKWVDIQMESIEKSNTLNK